MEQDQTKLKDIDEELRQRLIIDLLEKADQFMIYEKHEECYRTYKAIFNKIRPFEFKYRDELDKIIKDIDIALNGARGQALDGYQKIKIQEKQMEFLELIDILSRYIPLALKELGLYFKVIDQNLDDDEFFFDATFTVKKSLIQDKRNELKQLSSEELLKNLSGRQVNDVYSRYQIKTILGNS